MGPAGSRGGDFSRRGAESAEEIFGVGSGGGTLSAKGGGGDWEVLAAEMRRHAYEIGPTGQVSYAAPSGYHDDCVMALALGVWGCGRFGGEPGKMLRLGVFNRSATPTDMLTLV
jgi:hypothetical protein